MRIITLLCLLITVSSAALARSYVIFSLTQDLSMGFENEVIRKNYYINMGAGQGIRQGSVVDVFRIISIQNPYDNKKRVNYKVKIGELKIVHATDDSSIAVVHSYRKPEEVPIFEIPQFMVGDHVAVHVN